MSFFTRKTRPTISGRSLSRTFRPRLEMMEDRSVPSAGALDPTFGTGGIATTAINNTNAGAAWAVLMQPDSKIVAAGSPDFSLVRYNANGSLDTSFGSGGKATTSLGGVDAAKAAALYPTGTPNAGKIVLGGWAAKNWTADWDFALARFNANGSLDTTFGNKGKVLTDFSGTRDAINAIVLQADGKIVVAGSTVVAGLGTRFALARYNANGTLDSSFGSGGKVVTNIAGSEEFYGLAVQPDGKIAAAGYAEGIYYAAQPELVLARYTSSGMLDTTFGTGGIAVPPSEPSYEYAYAVALQTDGKFVVAGQHDDGRGHFLLARFNADGKSLDSTFGSNGRIVTAVSGWDRAFSVTIQPNGKIIAAGESNNNPSYGGSGAHSFALARYNGDGSLDGTFGNAGTTITAIGSANNGARSLALQADGKIVTAGYSSLGFTLARYEGDAPLQAASVAPKPTSKNLAASQVQPLLTEAISRWQATGVDTTALNGIDIRITNLSGTTLGMADGHTIWLDDNAAGWGWFVDPTPWDDSEFTTPGDQGEQGRMDLLTVIEHELGHLLGKEHEDFGVMIDTLSAGTRRVPSDGIDTATRLGGNDLFIAFLDAEEETTWIGGSIFGRGRHKR